MKKIAIFGAGGHASEIIDICDALGYTDISLVLMPNETSNLVDETLCKTENDINELYDSGYYFAIGIADGTIRSKISNRYKHLIYPSLIHPDASFGKRQRADVENTKGTIVAAGARFMSNITLGSFCSFGLNCTIGHDSNFGNFVSVMPGANISGNVKIMDKCFVGTGATIIQGSAENKLILCEGLTVGAGAVVTKSFEVGDVIIGVPAAIKS